MKVQRKQGKKNRKFGRNKIKCAKYFNEGKGTENKLRRFKKNNIGNDWSKTKIKEEIAKFIDLQQERQEHHQLTK